MTNEDIDKWIHDTKESIRICDEQHARMIAEWEEVDGPCPPAKNDCHSCDSDRTAIAIIEMLLDQRAM